MSANPTLKIAYADSTPNAIEPTVAQANIVKFNKSAIDIRLKPL